MKADIDVLVCEVGLRDGIQGIDQFFPTEQKKAWIRAEAAAGVSEIEVCSFVPPSVSGQFVDAAEIVADALLVDDLTVSTLVPNLRGAQRAFETGVNKISFVLSISESHNQANVPTLPAHRHANGARIPAGQRHSATLGLVNHNVQQTAA